jgi:hypothetical protein
MWKVLLITSTLLTLAATAAFPVALPNESQQSSIIATVMEQAQVSVPDEIVFDVTDVTQDTPISGLTVSATSVCLEAGKALRIELKADAADFTPPSVGAPTWAASDVSWTAGSWTGGTGVAGTLSAAAYNKIAESNVNASELSNSDMAFTIVAKPTIQFAGEYTVMGTWRFSSFTP